MKQFLGQYTGSFFHDTEDLHFFYCINIDSVCYINDVLKESKNKFKLKDRHTHTQKKLGKIMPQQLITIRP